LGTVITTKCEQSVGGNLQPAGIISQNHQVAA
jgi:hypothetical protein